MSQEFGGRSDKFGNEFERLWVTSLALRILDGTATSLLWEPLGSAGNGIELRLTRSDGLKEVHQCKIENKHHAKWTVSALKNAGVVDAMRLQLDRADVDRFVFVSRDPVRILDDLADRARRSNNDPSSFLQHSLSSKKHRDEFNALCNSWHLDPAVLGDVRQSIAYLQRLSTERGLWQPSERLQLERMARGFATGEGKAIIDSLIRFLSESLGNEVNASKLRHHLRSNGLPPRDLIDDQSIAAAIERLQSEFRLSLTRNLAGNSLIPRSITVEIHRLLTDKDGPQLIMIHGSAGHGKSAVLLELANYFDKEAIPFLPIRLDSQRPESGVAFFRDVLRLDAHPVPCLLSIAGNGPGILIVDQLDAVRWTAAHSESAWHLCREMIELAIARPNLRVVVACRTFDLDDDHRFKAWENELASRHKDRTASKRIEVALLEVNDVQNFVQSHGGVFEELVQRQRELLRIPLCLYLWWTLRLDNSLPLEFSTTSDLMRVFWRSRRRKLTAERQVSETQLTECLDRIVEYLDREGKQTFPAALVNRFQNVMDAIQSLHLVQSAFSSSLKFAHQSFLDYLVAERILNEWLMRGTSPLEWLRSRDQSLFRREQLRQVLFLQREQAPEEYAVLVRQLLHDADVRFHLRHLALGMLKVVASPTDAEYLLLLQLLEDSNWRKHALGIVLRGHGAWMEYCHAKGLFRKWLESGDQQSISDAIWIFRFTPTSHRYLVDDLLAPYANSVDLSWAPRIDAALPFSIGDDTEASFEWRLRRVRSGALAAELYDLQSAVKDFPIRVARLLEARLQLQIDAFEQLFTGGSQEVNSKPLEHERVGWSELLKHIHLAGWEGWTSLLPIATRSVAMTRKVRQMQLIRRKKSDPTSLIVPTDQLWKLHRTLKRFSSILCRMLSRIGRFIIRKNFVSVWETLSALDLSRSRILNRLACEVMHRARIEHADDVLNWLLADVRRFRSGDSRSNLAEKPAADLIFRFAPSCSEPVFRQLETAVLKSHGPEEKYSVKIQLEAIKERGVLLTNHYGRGQLVLLRAIPVNRMSGLARSALTTWLGKFGDPRMWKRDDRVKTGWGSSTIPIERKHLISDKNWLQLISTDWKTARQRRRSDNWLAERSHQMFARDFGECTKIDPPRFIRLANRIPINSPVEYFESVMRGLDQREAPQNRPVQLPVWELAPFGEVQSLILKMLDADILSDELTNAICWMIRNRAAERWSLRITDHIANACVNGRTPRGLPVELGDSGLNPWEGLRGVAVEALHQLVSVHPGFAVRYMPEILQCAQDHHASVRVSAVGLCNGLARWSLDSAVELFLIVCEHPDDGILSGIYAPFFLSLTWRRYSDSIEPVLRRMVESAQEDVSELGAYWAAGCYYSKGFYGDLAKTCRKGAVPQRKGFAKALADLTKIDECRDAALKILPDFFNDSDKSVSNQAAHVFYRNPDLLEYQAGPPLALNLVRSNAFQLDPSDLLRPLVQYSGSLLPYAEVMSAVVAAAAGPLASLIGNIQTRHAVVAHMLPNLLLRLYQEAEGQKNAAVRNRCLDAWDLLLQSQIVGLDTLDAIDA